MANSLLLQVACLKHSFLLAIIWIHWNILFTKKWIGVSSFSPQNLLSSVSAKSYLNTFLLMWQWPVKKLVSSCSWFLPRPKYLPQCFSLSFFFLQKLLIGAFYYRMILGQLVAFLCSCWKLNICFLKDQESTSKKSFFYLLLLVCSGTPKTFLINDI